MKNYLVFSMAALLVGASCNTKQEKAAEGFTGAPGEVKLITLDPGHFHAALVQKVSYPQVSKGGIFRGLEISQHIQRNAAGWYYQPHSRQHLSGQTGQVHGGTENAV